MESAPTPTETLAVETPEAPAVVAAPAVSATAAQIGAEIDAWFVEHFHGLGAHLDTFLYNRIHAAKADLRERLLALAAHLS